MELRELGRALSAAERAIWESRLQQLVGERIARVRYVDLEYDDPEQGAAAADPGRRSIEADAELHGLDYGLEIDFASGAQWWCTWQIPGAEGESLLSGVGRALTREVQGARVWDVSDVPPWSMVADVPITNVRILWDHWPADATVSSPELWCQNAYLIAFGDGTELVIALGERDVGSGDFRPTADNLAVFLSRDAAARCGFVLRP